MDLIHALVEANAVQNNDLNSIQILAINNNSNRSYESATSRFLVMQDGHTICSIKKIPNTPIYNIEYILFLQGRLEKGEYLGAPRIMGVTKTNDSIFIVEEYVSGESLDALYISDKLNKNELIGILSRIFSEALETEIIDKSKTFSAEKEIQQLLNEIKYLGWTENEEAALYEALHSESNQLKNSVKLVSGDLWLKNIILSTENKPYLVDYDLSYATSLKWIEIARVVHYAQHRNIDISLEDFASLLPKNIDIEIIQSFALLYEIQLQRKILDPGAFDVVKRNLILELRNICYSYFPVVFIKQEDQTEEVVENEYENYMQVYWQQVDENFSEENSIKEPLEYEVKKIYSTTIQAQSIKGLRIDPMNTPGMAEVKNVIIKNEHNEILCSWSADQIICTGTGKGVWSKNRLRIISAQDDPQLIWMLPKTVQAQKFHVLIEMKVTTDMNYVVDTIAETYDLREKIEEAQQEFARLTNEYSHMQNLLEQSKNELFLMKNDQLVKEQHIKLLSTELQTIVNSHSWKITKAFRSVGRKAKSSKQHIKNMLKKLAGEKTVPLLPIHDLVQENGLWRSVGKDPQFLLDIPYQNKLVQIDYTGSAEYVTPLELYYDLGNGMTEQQTIIVGTLNTGNEIHKRSRVRIPDGVHSFRLDPGMREQHFSLHNLQIRPIGKFEMLARPTYSFFKNNGFRLSTIKLFYSKFTRILKQDGLRGLAGRGEYIHTGINESDYTTFLKLTERTEAEWKVLQNELQKLSYKPLISILVPVYNVEEQWLRACIDSVRHQIYSNWELCLVDDCSTKTHIRPILEHYASMDYRIKVKFRTENGHISNTSNDAITMSSGEYVALLDHDDELSKDALMENVFLLNRLPEADIIYSDEDKISIEGERHSPFFKPNWSPDSLLSQMYTSHLTLYRKSLIEQVGGFRVGFEGSQDYDLILRVSEQTNQIYHIPKILYHWRAIPESTASTNSSKSYTHVAGIKAVEEAIQRRELNAYVDGAEDVANLYRVHYEPVGNPKVSIIIPSKNMTDVVNTCLTSIFEKTSYLNYEVIIVDNGSSDPTTHQLYERWQQQEPERFKVYSYDIPFNYSKLNNFGCTKANGELLLFLNNDIEIITPDWMSEMAGQAIRREIGAVGANLLYPDRTIQHAGVILGIGGVAGHSHKHFQASDYGYFSRLKMVSNYSAVTAACLMIRKEICEEVGGFNEELQVAFNDVDFCLKVREKGYWNIWLPQAQLFHYESKSRGYEDTPEKQKRFNSEVERMKKRWPDELIEDPFYNPNLSKEHEDFSIGKPFKNDFLSQVEVKNA